MNKTYTQITPSAPKVPLIISSPHSGTQIPQVLAEKMTPQAVQSTDSDTLIHKIYSFAASLGITQIYSEYSRYVIDLNRPQNKKSLYDDGRSETELIPTMTFAQKPIYENYKVTKSDESSRIEQYYKPYHEQLSQLIQEMLADFGKVLLFEAHSITRFVPAINKNQFPDLIIGTLDGATCDLSIEKLVLDTLESDKFEVSLNSPFKGGFITRQYADPSNGIHTLQLEMCKDLYMNSDETELDKIKADKISNLLRQTFELLTQKVMEL